MAQHVTVLGRCSGPVAPGMLCFVAHSRRVDTGVLDVGDGKGRLRLCSHAR